GAEECLVADIATRLVGKVVVPRVRYVRCVCSADAAALSTMDGDANKIGLRLGSRCGGFGFNPFGATATKGLRHVAEWSRPGVLQLDVGRRNPAEIATRPRVRHPGCGRILLSVRDHVRQAVPTQRIRL